MRNIIEELESKKRKRTITKVTHISECEKKELVLEYAENYSEIKGEYVIDFHDPNFKVRTSEAGMFKLVPAQFGLKTVKQTLLKEKMFDKLQTIDLTNKLKTFLDKAPVLREYGVSLVKRGILLHGDPGLGKTHQINECVSQIIGDNGVSFSFSMSEIGIGHFVDHLQENPPSKNIDKLIVVFEDLGGGEMPDLGHRVMGSQDELLGFLDGNNIPDNWRHLPIIIFSTTNYPMLFLANLIDRPGRFDEVIEVTYPDPSVLVEYAENFMNSKLTDFDKNEIMKGTISIAHIKDACIKKLVYDEPINLSVKKMRDWTARVKKSLEKKESF